MTHAAIEKTEWKRRARGAACPICNRMSWCTVSSDGKTVRCTRVESLKPAPGKDGCSAWLHSLSGEQFVKANSLESSKATKKLSQPVVAAMAKAAYCREDAYVSRLRLSNSLGLSYASLEALRVGSGRDEWNGNEWTSWPSKDENGNVIGISRRYADGSKKTIKGTTPGLFYVDRLSCGRHLSRSTCLIVEGGSDVAAAYMMGIFAIGRPSNTGGARLIAKVIKTGLSAVVVGENDCDPDRRGQFGWCSKECKGCLRCWPGLYGAQAVSKQLGVRYIMPPDGCKDLRDVVQKCCVSEFLLRIN